MKNNEMILEKLNDYSSYRQGGTNNNFTILIRDIDRIYTAFNNISDEKTKPEIRIDPDHRQLLRETNLSRIVNKCTEQFSEMDTNFDNFLEEIKTENILEITSSIRMKYIQLGLPTQNVSFDNLEHALKSIFNQDIITLEKQYKSFLLSKDEESFDKKIEALGKLNTVDLFMLEKLIISINSIIDEIKKEISLRQSQIGQSDTTVIIKNLKKQISNNLNNVDNLDN